MPESIDAEHTVTEAQKFAFEKEKHRWGVALQIATGIVIAFIAFAVSSCIEYKKLELESRRLDSEIEKNLLVSYLDIAKEKDSGVWNRSLDVIEIVSTHQKTIDFVKKQRETYSTEFLYAEQMASLKDEVASKTILLSNLEKQLASTTKVSQGYNLKELEWRLWAKQQEIGRLQATIEAYKSGKYDLARLGFRQDPRLELSALQQDLAGLEAILRTREEYGSNDRFQAKYDVEEKQKAIEKKKPDVLALEKAAGERLMELAKELSEAKESEKKLIEEIAVLKARMNETRQ